MHELTRHSDHHYNQEISNSKELRMIPYLLGYPASILLSFIPPCFAMNPEFLVMKSNLTCLKQRNIN